MLGIAGLLAIGQSNSKADGFSISFGGEPEYLGPYYNSGYYYNRSGYYYPDEGYYYHCRVYYRPYYHNTTTTAIEDITGITGMINPRLTSVLLPA